MPQCLCEAILRNGPAQHLLLLFFLFVLLFPAWQWLLSFANVSSCGGLAALLWLMLMPLAMLLLDRTLQLLCWVVLHESPQTYDLLRVMLSCERQVLLAAVQPVSADN
jgi:hypothetical protein